ncbi:MAG: helix-turn-helix domain-containing protein [Oscillospiraceae bacterium]|nr:helix-turn-helix domain-containing protein [Oscillospiraceae bacterium]
MDQQKIGKFIAERRKMQGYTQMQLAEKLNITDRAVSKWETGRALPDTSIMMELCGILKISVNDLLSGEVVSMDNYNKELENNLIEMVKQKETADKRLLKLEIFIGVLVSAVFVAMILIASLVQMDNWLKTVLIIIGVVPFFAGMFYALRIEQVAGYYKCAKCGHKYIPSYTSVFFSMHINRTRYMRCPKCAKRSWQKKVISKE